MRNDDFKEYLIDNNLFYYDVTKKAELFLQLVTFIFFQDGLVSFM